MDIQDQERLKQLADKYPQTYTTEADLRLVTQVHRGFEVSKDLAKVLIEHGGVWQGRQRLFGAKTMISAGACLQLHTPPHGVYQVPQVEPHMILHEQETFLVFNKPPGWFCVATPWDVLGTLEQALTAYLKQRDGRTPQLHLVHRLDQQTSGLLVVSKTAQVNGAFQRSFSDGTVKKRYQALCTGTPDWDTYTLRTGHSRGKNGLWQLYPAEMIGQAHGPNDRIIRDAVTTFTVVQRFAQATLVEAELHTGRTHQIRLQLAELGHAILGDTRYGSVERVGQLQLPHHLLHAWKLTVPHPLSGYRLTWTAPAPPLWEQVTHALQSAQA